MSRKNRKRKLQDEEQKTNDGEQDNFFPDEMRKEMETMWEIPQIFHFLYLTRESLSIPQLSMYEVERMLSIPRASKQLANIMTCLLSSPITKAKLRKVPPMPYEFWTNILAHKMASWFKVYYTKHKDPIKVLESIGIEPEFWNIFPDASLLEGKDFEDLSFKQRIWLLKTVCDTIMHTRKTVQEDIAKQAWEDQFETVLGVDRYGARYIYFPQFIPNDLRIYRHCVDNKILSTVKPVRSKQETEKTKTIGTRLSKYKKEKLQSHNNLSVRRSNRHKNRIDNKDLSNDKCNNDSATGSFISEDTNLSSTSTCSNNNNNISLDTINRKRSRRLSKMSEESTLSNARSSGYDTNTSSDKSVCDESTQMFKGFVNSQDDNCSIGIINEMLHDLKSEIDEERKTNECGGNGNSELVLQENLVVELYTSTGSCSETLAVERDENERLNDNLSSSSKTDDEKLNDIISAESSKLPEDIYLKSVSISDNVSDISTTSKSDDEKLNETKTSDGNVSVNTNSSNKKVIFNRLCAPPIDSASLSEDVVRHECFSEVEVPPSIMKTKSNDFIQERKLRKRTKLRSRYKTTQCNEEIKTEAIRNKVKQVEVLEDIKTDEIDDKSCSASQMLLQEDIEDNLDDYTNDSDTAYNLRKSKDPKIDEYKKDFNQMLLDLSVSDFQLVVDNVEGLRDLIANFSESKNTNNAKNTPMCQIKLVEKLTELLNFLEPLETTLKDTTRKAKSKLQREWSNFKEGSVEDQDSSSEGGLSSNWWILGSQGRDPLSTSGDTTLQTLPQPALSPFGAQSSQQSQSAENEHENAVKSSEIQQSCHEIQESIDERQDEDGDKQTDVETSPRGNQAEEEEKRQHGKIESTSNDEDTEKQQTRRVLRARGVSSYTEQFYSDDETEEDELEEWTDVEAVYAAPGTQIDTSTSHAASKDRYADNWSDQEDSDQDWILPGSRKRKNKRASTNRRLKSFHQKLQNIKENTSQSDVTSSVPHLDNAKIGKDKLKTKLKDDKEAGSTRIAESSSVSSDSTVASTSFATSNENSRIPVPSTDAICKIESVNSVHSELDIKDEGPIYEFGPTNHYEITPSPQQNYCYMMPHNPGIAGGDMTQGVSLMQQTNAIQGYASQVHTQNYYVQPNYMMQNSQASFLPATHHQQRSIFQQQCPQMMSVQPSTWLHHVNSVGYVPPMVATTHQVTSVPPIANQQNPQNLIHCTQKLQNRYSQNNRHIMPRQNLSHPNSAVIRNNNTPIRGGYRKSKTKSIRSNVPQPRMPNPNAASKQKVPQTSSTKDSVQKTTSLIVISDSDDEIEMIITEKTASTAEKGTPTNITGSVSRKSVNQPKPKPTITSDITVTSAKGVLPPQIIQRMSQGGISITPVKNNTTPPPATNNNTQLVVVVNETGSHYALSLPNGSKLILTPEQVAQIRASNGGKLIL